ncbi:hypothetical protein J6E39_08450 [bacterium]|nr:hypothetical protein [bacterium]
MGSNGSRVNPAFITAFNNLKTAKMNYNAIKATGNKEQARVAELHFHQAENYFCDQEGILSGGNMTESQAKAAVDSMMSQVHSWYA